jgi:mercuric ion transport protein
MSTSIKVQGSLVAGALAAVGASLCCVAPLVLLAMGIGGAWVANLTAMEPMRPWFIAATVFFLGLALRRLYFQPQRCEPGAVCAAPIVVRRQRWIFWLVTVALLALLSVPWVAPFFL